MPAKKFPTRTPAHTDTPADSPTTSAAPTRPARRHFDAAYKLRIARMIGEDGASLSQVCRDQSLTPSAVRRWVVQLGCEQAGERGVGKPLTADQQRIRQLEAQLRQLQSDCELLKKASALFARELR